MIQDEGGVVVPRVTIVLLVGASILVLRATGAESLAEHASARRGLGVEAGELTTSHLRIAGVTVGLDSLAQVQRVFGRARPYDIGRHGDHVVSVCYTSGGQGDTTTLVFSSGPLGGWQETTSVDLLSDRKSVSAKATCTRSPLVSRRLATESGLRLGLRREEVTAILGPATRESKDELTYAYARERPLTAEEMQKFPEGGDVASIMSGAWFALSGGRVSNLALYRQYGE